MKNSFTISGFIFNFLIEIVKLPFNILNKILKLPTALLGVFVLLLIGAILIIVNHFQVPGGLSQPNNINEISNIGLNDAGIAGIVILTISGLILIRIVLEIIWLIIGIPWKVYKKTIKSKKYTKVGPQKRSPRRKS